MVIVIILIGTILLVGLLIGCLAWLLKSEEKPHTKHVETVPLSPVLSKAPVAASVQEVVVESSEEVAPVPQPFVPQLVPLQAPEDIKSVSIK